MHGFLLQDWTTIRMQFGLSNVIQTEANWLDLQGYQDAVMWLEVREASFATGTSPPTQLKFDYETSPTRDESMFRVGVSSAAFTGPFAAGSTPDVQKILVSSTVPLARWLRWKLAIAAGGVGTVGASDVTFRIAVAANMIGGR